MATRTIEVDADLLPLMLDSCHIKRAESVSRRDQADDEVSEWDRKIAAIEKAMAQADGVPKAVMENGRVKRGQSEEILVKFLSSQNGTGATIREINRATGTKYGTTLRLLNIFQDKGWVNRIGDSRDSRWAWNPKIVVHE